MNIHNKKSIRRRRVLLVLAVNIIDFVRIPFSLIAYPNRWLCRLVKAICNSAIRLRFIEGEYCGGCSRYGTKKCHSHCKNPYWNGGMDRGCYTVR